MGLTAGEIGELAGASGRPLSEEQPGLKIGTSFRLRSRKAQAADYRADIDGLRAIAVLSVVLFHAGFIEFSGGFVGVDVFFVISGFLITRIIRKGVLSDSFKFGQFYVRRARRLFPAMFATVLLTFVASAVLLSPDLFKQFAASSVAALFSASNFYFWFDSGYFSDAAIQKPLLHTWSLGVEEQFYLIWPLLLAAVLRFSDRAAFWLLALLGLASLACSFLLMANTSLVFYLMPFRIFELAAGGLLVWIVERSNFPNAALEAAVLCGLGLIGFAVFSLDAGTPFPVSGLLPTLGAALCIFGGTARSSGYLLGNPLCVRIGLISYSVYLVHWPIVVLSRFIIDRDLLPKERLAMVVAALVGGALMYALVEQRFRRGDRPRSLRPLAYASGCLAAVAAVTAVAASAYFSGGWTWRLGEREQAYVAAASDVMGKYGGFECRPAFRCAQEGEGRPLYFIGDSHGLAYFAGVKARFPNRPFVFFEANACPFFSVHYNSEWLTHYAAGRNCVETRDIAFAELRNQSDYDLVIAQNWQPHDMIDIETGAVVKLSTDRVFSDFILSQLNILKDELHPRSLTIIGNVPTTGSAASPVDCLGRPFQSLAGCEEEPINKAIAPRKRTNEALKAALEGTVRFLDPFDALCSADHCANMIDGHTLYDDWDHLSGWGSEYVVRKLFTQ